MPTDGCPLQRWIFAKQTGSRSTAGRLNERKMLIFLKMHNENAEICGDFRFRGNFEERNPENEWKKGGKIFILRLFLFIMLKMRLQFMRKFYVLTMEKTLQSER